MSNKFRSGTRVDEALDQFYTKPEVAKYFVRKIREYVRLNRFDNVIEPSAGSGNILKYLPKKTRHGLDLDPAADGIEKIDFFKYTFPVGKNIVVGNPPFGRNSKLAIGFFNRSAMYCDTIAFIVPNSWSKKKVQAKLDPSFRLIFEEKLKPFSFIKQGISPGKRMMDDGSININCVMQIWTRNGIMKDVDLRKKNDPACSHEDFTLHGYFTKEKKNISESTDYDFLLRSWGSLPFPKNGPSALAFGSIRTSHEELKGNWKMQYTAIKANEPEVYSIFKSIPIEEWWTSVSSMNTITSDVIIELYSKYKKLWDEQPNMT